MGATRTSGLFQSTDVGSVFWEQNTLKVVIWVWRSQDVACKHHNARQQADEANGKRPYYLNLLTGPTHLHVPDINFAS